MKKRADGRYQANVYLGKVDGKPSYKTVYATTQKELNEKILNVKLEKKKGIDVLKGNSKFREWGEKFLETQKEKQTDSVYKIKKYYIEYFNQYIGDIPIVDIRFYDIEQVLTHLASGETRTKKPASAKTMREYKSTIGQVFTFAMKNRVLDFNPCEFAEIPKTQTAPKKRRALSQKEIDAITKCKCYAHYIAMTSIYTGLRRGELAALNHSDIDLKKGIIYVNKSYDYHNYELKGTKTEAGERIVPMPQILINCLKTLPKKSIFAFSVDGNRLTQAQWESLLRDLYVEMETFIGGGKQVKAGQKYKALISFKPFGWHDLRHTYATLLHESGVGNHAKYLLGHSDISTTLNVYTHLSEAQNKNSVDKINSYISQHISQTS